MFRSLSALTLSGLALLTLAGCAAAPTSSQPVAATSAKTSCEPAPVKGMTGKMCAHAVTGTLKKQAGVTDVAVDVPNGKVRITTQGDALPRSSIKSAVEHSGYTLVSVTPGC